MCKKLLRDKQMSAVTFVQDASTKTRWLVERESRGAGDTRNAMERIARRYGIPFQALWTLRYREPRDILVSVYSRICEAHEAECSRQARLLNEELQKAQPNTLVGRLVVRAAIALDRKESAALTGDGA
jgi:hypothetical protein